MKSAKSCNLLFLADDRGLMLACSCLLAGQHQDLFRIKQVFRQFCDILKEAGIGTDGLFLNADAGFDSRLFRRQCTGIKIKANMAFHARNAEPPEACTYFDEELFKRRNAIERANAWLDSFKALLIRSETKAQHWLNLYFLAFSVQLIYKINKEAVY